MSDETPTPAERKPETAPETPAAETTESVAGTSVADTASEPGEAAAAEPADAALVTPEVDVVPSAAEPVPVTSDPAAVPVEPSAAAASADPAAPAPAPPVGDPGHRVVYLETPTPPRIRGNRVVGTLLALVGAVVYAGVFAVVGGLLYFFGGRELFGDEFGAFVASAAFWVPILVFVLAFILEVVIVNRGGWAAHVFGSLLLAFVVYFASIGLLLLVGNVFSQQHVTFAQIALTPQIIASAVIAREVAIWFGLAIARRGRSVRERNAEARAKHEQELAEQRARFARPVPPTTPPA